MNKTSIYDHYSDQKAIAIYENCGLKNRFN